MSVNIRIKKMLEDIIDVAYPYETPEERARYKKFYIEILPKEKKSASGHYVLKTHAIQVYNLSLGEKHLAKCCLHELSHHIELRRTGNTGHQKSFYEVYTKLIYAALDMGIMEKHDFDDNWSSDANKVRKIVQAYIPHKVEYKKETRTIYVRDCFSMKDLLKERDYKWSGLEKAWVKDVDDEEDEITYLESIGVCSYEVKDSTLQIDLPCYIGAVGETYSIKDQLKERGFHFKKEKKCWIKQVKDKEAVKSVIKDLEKEEIFRGIKFVEMRGL